MVVRADLYFSLLALTQVVPAALPRLQGTLIKSPPAECLRPQAARSMVGPRAGAGYGMRSCSASVSFYYVPTEGAHCPEVLCAADYESTLFCFRTAMTLSAGCCLKQRNRAFPILQIIGSIQF